MISWLLSMGVVALLSLIIPALGAIVEYGSSAWHAQTTPIGEGVPTLTLWLTVLAVLTALATEGIKKLPEHLSRWQKQLIAAIIAGLLAGITVAYEGRFDFADWSRTWLIVFMGATTLYVVIAKPLHPPAGGP